jgi:hypothetical protein
LLSVVFDLLCKKGRYRFSSRELEKFITFKLSKSLTYHRSPACRFHNDNLTESSESKDDNPQGKTVLSTFERGNFDNFRDNENEKQPSYIVHIKMKPNHQLNITHDQVNLVLKHQPNKVIVLRDDPAFLQSLTSIRPAVTKNSEMLQPSAAPAPSQTPIEHPLRHRRLRRKCMITTLGKCPALTRQHRPLWYSLKSGSNNSL